jgi:hypothetical protein
MDAIDKAIRAIKLQKLRDKIIYQEYANKYHVLRSALSRRHRGVLRSKQAYAASKQSLTLQQELELVRYIEKLTKRGLPPTREIIKNFASSIAY